MDVITRPDTEGRHEALRIGGKNVETDARLKMRFSPLWRSRPARLSGSDGRRPVVTGPNAAGQLSAVKYWKRTVTCPTYTADCGASRPPIPE
jgi:hypothetical protein